MANKFTQTDFFYNGTNSAQETVLFGTIVIDTAVGAAAGTFLPAVFGLRKFTGVCYFTKSTNDAFYTAVPAQDGFSLIVMSGTTAGGFDLPNGTYVCRIVGN